MERLITILRAAHCRSTHHFFAVDALPYVTTQRGKCLCTVLLKHHQRYLVGAKDPDKKFRDFRNHVLHVGDSYWGGAPKSAAKWYARVVECLDQSRWSDAAYAAGVLSHYFTDPLMPLHTGQSEKESIVHRPLEWSVKTSYDRILNHWKQGHHKVVFDLATSPDWMNQAVVCGADVAHRHYDELIDDYDLAAGAKRPTDGFPPRSIDTLAGLFGIAITGWARILEKAAEETRSEIPSEPLSIPALLAGIKMPVAWIIRRIESRAEQRAVKALFDEFQQTGTVKQNLPAEVRSVAENRERDRASQQPQRPASQSTRTEPLGRNVPNSALAPAVSVDAAPNRPRVPDSKPAHDQLQEASLHPGDNLVDAPSIGPKTARRFADIGITTVQQFLDGSPARMAAALDTRWITEEKLQDWQDQARLVCEVASLCGYKAQLLVGVECRSARQLAACQASALHAELKQYCGTSAGKRALRSSKLPSPDDVGRWIRDAAVAGLRRSA